LKFGDSPGGGVSLDEKPPRKLSPYSDYSGGNLLFHDPDQKQNTRSVGEVDYKDELDLDEFGVHNEGYEDTDDYGFPASLEPAWHSEQKLFTSPNSSNDSLLFEGTVIEKQAVWHPRQSNGKLVTSPHSSSDFPVFEGTVIGKQPVWHSMQPSGKLAASPHSSSDSLPFEGSVIEKQSVSIGRSPLVSRC